MTFAAHGRDIESQMTRSQVPYFGQADRPGDVAAELVWYLGEDAVGVREWPHEPFDGETGAGLLRP